MIETICFLAAILLIVIFTPWFTHIANIFIGVIPAELLVFLTLAVVIRFILFVIHRGADS